MPPGRARLYVWCEDQCHEQFVRELCTKRLGIQRRDLTFHIAPKGSGAASRWVIQQYQEAARLARAAKHQTMLGFLLVVDGDNEGVAERKRSMLSLGTGERDEELRLAIWVPTWSIETWVMHLSAGVPVGPANSDLEKNTLKKAVEPQWSALLPKAIEQWDKYPASDPDSLRDAYDECQRLPFA